jgi:cytochrome b561
MGVSVDGRYTRIAIGLHWLLALLIAGGFVLGLFMTELELSSQKLKLYAYHKWLGVSVALLVLLRAAYRLTHPPPALPPTLPRWEVWLARVGHVALYALMLAVPVSGWLMSSAGGFQTVWFGVLPLPDLLAKDRALFDTLKEVHEALNYTLLSLVSVHVAAVIKHQWIDRNAIWHRMTPWRRG